MPDPVAAAPEIVAPPADAPPVDTPAVAAPAVIEVDPDYAFSAIRDGDGAVILSGQVPADAALRQFATTTEADAAAVSIAGGAPENFLASAEIGLQALLRLQSGQLDFANGTRRIVGMAGDAAGRDAVLAAIAADNAASWTSDVKAPAIPVETAIVPPPQLTD
ncbi:MAG: hypothetical protein MO852_14945 [Candidatus Devosia euplotis]|nr:hypothetical protein [Candidatus Devosia euplotis]